MEPINPYAAPQSSAHEQHGQPPPAPVTLADTLRVATSLYTGNLLPILGITLTFWLPIELTQSYLAYFPLDPENPSEPTQVALLLQNVIGLIPVAGVMAIGAAALKGEPATYRVGFVEGFAAWPRMFVTRLTVSMAIVLAMILFIIPGIYVSVRTAFAEPAALIEHRGGMSAPGRSFELTKGRFWRTLGLLCIAYGYLFALAFLAEVPVHFFEHWLLEGGLAVLIDLLSGWAILVLVAAYWGLATAPRTDELAGPMPAN